VTDAALAQAVEQAAYLEALARAALEMSVDDLPEHDAALVVVRQAVAVRRALETWIVDRAVRASRRSAVVEG
jgi:hypothetical protein